MSGIVSESSSRYLGLLLLTCCDPKKWPVKGRMRCECRSRPGISSIICKCMPLTAGALLSSSEYLTVLPDDWRALCILLRRWYDDGGRLRPAHRRGGGATVAAVVVAVTTTLVERDS